MTDRVGIIIGRFQVLTKAHEAIIKAMASNHKKSIVYLIKGKQTSKDLKKNPLDEKLQLKMLKKICPESVEIKVLPTAFIPDELNKLPERHYTLYAGSDRAKSYQSYEKYLEDGRELDVIEIKRDDDSISATKARECLLNEDTKGYEAIVPAKTLEFTSEITKALLKAQVP